MQHQRKTVRKLAAHRNFGLLHNGPPQRKRNALSVQNITRIIAGFYNPFIYHAYLLRDFRDCGGPSLAQMSREIDLIPSSKSPQYYTMI